MNWLNENFEFGKYDTAWVGYTSHNKGTVAASYFGRWYGYAENGLIADFQFKYLEDQKIHMLRYLYASYLGLFHLMENMHHKMGHAKVFLPSKRMVRWLNDGVTYRKNSIAFKDRFEHLMRLLNPTVESYNPEQFPFKVIKEMTMIELEGHRHKAGTYESLADLSVPDL